MILLLDIGNTHTHLGLANQKRVVKRANIPTARWFGNTAAALIKRFVGEARVDGAALCSVVPRATPLARRAVKRLWNIAPVELTPRTVRGVGINYPRPQTIGPDRLANAVAVRHHFGAPAVVVDFGTAVTFDVVDRRGDYVGGIIAPGVVVPLHSHPEPETFIAISGRIEGLKESDGKFGWVSIGPGDVFHVPG